LSSVDANFEAHSEVSKLLNFDVAFAWEIDDMTAAVELAEVLPYLKFGLTTNFARMIGDLRPQTLVPILKQR
jgi:hypothetical protein